MRTKHPRTHGCVGGGVGGWRNAGDGGKQKLSRESRNNVVKEKGREKDKQTHTDRQTHLNNSNTHRLTHPTEYKLQHCSSETKHTICCPKPRMVWNITLSYFCVLCRKKCQTQHSTLNLIFSHKVSLSFQQLMMTKVWSQRQSEDSVLKVTCL